MNDLYSLPHWLDGVRKLSSMPDDPERDPKREVGAQDAPIPPRVELRLSNSSQVRRPKR